MIPDHSGVIPAKYIKIIHERFGVFRTLGLQRCWERSTCSVTTSVVFLRDSFSTDLAVFAKETFHSTVLLHHWFGHFREDEVLRYKPDVVVYELLERGLAWELK